MKEYILDANVIFSAIISGKPVYIQLFEHNKYFSPDFALYEIDKYKSLILKKTNLSIEDFQSFIRSLFSHITIIPSLYITEINRIKATELCNDIDPKDTMYVALAIEMNVTLITRDILLFNGLRKKGFTDVILFDDFIRLNH